MPVESLKRRKRRRESREGGALHQLRFRRAAGNGVTAVARQRRHSHKSIVYFDLAHQQAPVERCLSSVCNCRERGREEDCVYIYRVVRFIPVPARTRRERWFHLRKNKSKELYATHKILFNFLRFLFDFIHIGQLMKSEIVFIVKKKKKHLNITSSRADTRLSLDKGLIIERTGESSMPVLRMSNYARLKLNVSRLWVRNT